MFGKKLLSDIEKEWIFYNEIEDDSELHNYVSEWVKVLNMRMRPETSPELKKHEEEKVIFSDLDTKELDIPSIEEQLKPA